MDKETSLAGARSCFSRALTPPRVAVPRFCPCRVLPLVPVRSPSTPRPPPARASGVLRRIVPQPGPPLHAAAALAPAVLPQALVTSVTPRAGDEVVLAWPSVPPPSSGRCFPWLGPACSGRAAEASLCRPRWAQASRCPGAQMPLLAAPRSSARNAVPPVAASFAAEREADASSCVAPASRPAGGGGWRRRTPSAARCGARGGRPPKMCPWLPLAGRVRCGCPRERAPPQGFFCVVRRRLTSYAAPSSRPP